MCAKLVLNLTPYYSAFSCSSLYFADWLKIALHSGIHISLPFPTTNHWYSVCICKPVFAFVALPLHQRIAVHRAHMETKVLFIRSVGLNQTLWLIRQCLDCICFSFVSHRLH